MISPLKVIKEIIDNPCSDCICAECHTPSEECIKKAWCDVDCKECHKNKKECTHGKHRPFSRIEKDSRTRKLYKEAKEKIRNEQ